MTLPKTPSFRLHGKQALVAGASSGLGLACAAALAEAGAEGIIAGASADKLAEIARAEGMRSLRESGLLAIYDGLTTPEEVVRETVFN